MTSTILTSFILGIACQSEVPTATHPKNIVLTTTKHRSSKKDDFEKMSFQCCDDEQSNALLDKYLRLTRAMASDDDAGTKAAISELMEFSSISAFTAEDGLSELTEALPVWSTWTRKAIQEDLSEASTAVINYTKKHRSKTGTTIIVGFCPMAPGRWLQTEKVISNPYYGSAMLTCGVFEE